MPSGSTSTLLVSGFMGSGKSTVGRRAAELCSRPFVDLDALIEAEAGRTVAEIFASEGEAGFRRREAEHLTKLLETPGERVVAVGGGALLDTTVRRAALARAFVATLHASPATLLSRTPGKSRPLLDVGDRGAAVKALLETRGPAYRECHAEVSTEAHGIDEAARALVEAWSIPTIAVALGARSYGVRFGAAGARHVVKAGRALAPSGAFVVTDANVAPLWGTTLAATFEAEGGPARATVTLEAGEEHKQLAAVETVLRSFIAEGADRSSLVVGHGGGVVTDIAGFAAATLFRGVRWVALPTTLLAMVDASVGGKTGVDLGPAKNAVGAFHQPSAVAIDVAHVTTETFRNYRSGFAEVVKAACIADPELFEELEAGVDLGRARDLAFVERLAFRSIAVKAAIVARDEHEQGERVLLNFGHTVGHALESQGGFTKLTHGEAVSLGMIAALRVGERLGVTSASVAARVRLLLEGFGLPVDLDAEPLEAALGLLAFDKKRRGGAIRVILLRALGEMVTEALTVERLRDLLRK